MLRGLLFVFSSMHVSYAISMLVKQTSIRFWKKRVKSCRKIGGEDKISTLPDDLLVEILLFLPTKEVIATMILSKRWQTVWTMVPTLRYREINDKVFTGGLLGRLLGCLLGRLFGKSDQQQQSIWQFLDESLKLHKAPVLEILVMELGPRCPVDVDVGKWIANAVERKVRKLACMLMWSAEPASLSKSLYTCDTLVTLYLTHKVLIDVPSLACLPSLKVICLYYVVYKDEDSIVRLLSSCPILKYLSVERYHQDNVKTFNIKVPSLECLSYNYNFGLGVHDNDGIERSLIIDSPALKKLFFEDSSEDFCSFENKTGLDKASIYVTCYPNEKFMKSLSSVRYLDLGLSIATVTWYNTIFFSQLMECKITLLFELEWLESLLDMLHNSPHLKVLFIETFIQHEEDLSFSWNEPSSVPGCLSTHLEIFEWKGYRGRSEEMELVRYIFANSKCLKRAGISMKSTYELKDREKMVKELESVSRVSTSSQLLFSTQVEYLNIQNEINVRENEI